MTFAFERPTAFVEDPLQLEMHAERLVKDKNLAERMREKVTEALFEHRGQARILAKLPVPREETDDAIFFARGRTCRELVLEIEGEGQEWTVDVPPPYISPRWEDWPILTFVLTAYPPICEGDGV